MSVNTIGYDGSNNFVYWTWGKLDDWLMQLWLTRERQYTIPSTQRTQSGSRLQLTVCCGITGIWAHDLTIIRQPLFNCSTQKPWNVFFKLNVCLCLLFFRGHGRNGNVFDLFKQTSKHTHSLITMFYFPLVWWTAKLLLLF